MPFQFSQRSRDRLADVHPDLVRVVERALEITPVDFMVVEGVRSDEQAFINYGKGRTVEECAAKSVPAKYAQPSLDKVTWLKDPLATKHRRQADGFSHAVDLLPSPYDWKAAEPFDQLAMAMRVAAGELGVHIRWGADWDEDGNPREKGESDSPHFELAASPAPLVA